MQNISNLYSCDVKSIEISKKKIDFFSIFSFIYFSISHISRLLEILGVPRIASYIVYLLFLAVFVVKTIRKISFLDIVFYAILVPILLVGTIRYGNYDSPIAQYAAYLLFLPAFYVFRFLKPEKIKSGLIGYAYFSLFYIVVYYLKYINGTTGYHMEFSYWLAQSSCILFYVFLQKRRILPLVISIIGLLIIVILGSRGAFLLALLSILIMYVFVSKLTKKIVLKAIMIGIIVSLILLFRENISEFLGATFSNSRTITKLLSGKLFSSQSRNEIYLFCQNLIKQNPSGYGVFASRMLIPAQPYPHSLFYELQLDYGKLMGISIFVFVIIMTFVAFIKSIGTNYFLPVVIFAVIGLGSLMVSSSYLQEATIPSLLAIFINCINIKSFKRGKNNKYSYYFSLTK